MGMVYSCRNRDSIRLKLIMAKKKVNKTDWRIVSVGLICLTAVEITALLLGYNGTILKFFMVVVGVAIGVTIENPLKTK